MSVLLRLTNLGPMLDDHLQALPRSLAGPSVLATALPERFSLDASAMEIDRRVRREHMRVTIPFQGPSPWRVQDEINRLLKASMSDSGSLERLRAVHLEVQETTLVLSAASAAHAVEHWLGGTRLVDALVEAIETAIRRV